MTESGGSAHTHRGPVVDRRQASRRGGLAPPRISTDLRDQATAATKLGRVLTLGVKRHSAGASSYRPFPTRDFVLAGRNPGIAQACPACLSIGRCRGLASGDRRRRFRGARQPFGNASLTQTSYGSQTSGKPVGALPRIRKTLTNQSSERWTPPRPVRQCAGPHLSTGGRHRAKPFQEGRCSSGRGCYGDAHGGLFVR